jgi:hypothetical protein
MFELLYLQSRKTGNNLNGGMPEWPKGTVC